MPYTTELSREEDPAIRKAITGPLVAYNTAHLGASDYVPLIVALRDATGTVCGGLWGHTAHGWLFVQFLVVGEAARGQGLGSRLITVAETEALDRGCHSVWLDTFEFQAKGFYEKLGFVQFGELTDYPPPYSRYFLKKRLTSRATGA